MRPDFAAFTEYEREHPEIKSQTYSAIIGQASETVMQGNPWPEIIPFDAPIETEDFNLEVLPGAVRDYCKAVCDSLSVRPGMVGPIALGCLATIYQRRYEIRGKPDWVEPLQLFTIVSAPPSSGKSPVLSKMLAPFREWEQQKQMDEKPVIAAEKSEMRMLQKRIDAAEKAAAGRGNDAKTSRLEAVSLAEELSGKEEPHETVLFTSDCTEEALVALLKEQGGELTLASGEGGFLTNLKGRYKSVPDIDAILQAYSGEEIRLNRIGRGATVIRNPRLTVMLCCQPSALTAFLADGYLQGRGATARFLCSQPGTLQGEATINTPPIPKSISAAYRDFVFRELDSADTGEITMSDEAKEVFFEAADLVLNEAKSETEALAEWDGKHRGNLLRICGLLHAATSRQPTVEPVPAAVVYAAWQIMDYFRSQYFSLMAQTGQTEAERDARYLLDKLGGVERISKRDLFKKCQSHFKKTEKMEKPIIELADRGYIRVDRLDTTGGRPSEIITVNPNYND
jgi:hypothetical protein